MTRIKERLGEIVGKTYLEHGLGDRPFGTMPDSTRCSYAAGCAIGISMSKDFREDVMNFDIDKILEEREVQEDLFGWQLTPGERRFAARVLAEVQGEHDAAAIHKDKQLYATDIKGLAERHGLALPEPGGKT